MSALAVSQIEKHFITNQIYKRSKRYFDILKLKSIQNLDSKFRRAPSNPQREQLQKKIQNSFMSSQQYFNKKRVEEIQKCKKKHCSSQFFDDTDETETNYSVVTKKNLSAPKAFDMSKSLSRDFYENLQSHAYTSIQDPFDNFVSSDFSKGQKGKSIDFNKILGRKDIITQPSLASKNKNPQENLDQQKHKSVIFNNPEKGKTEDINKIYEKLYFDQSNFKCLIDVQKERKAQHRKSLRTALKQYETKKQISLQKIQKGLACSTKKPVPSSLMFYHGKGKQEPSSMHIRLLKKNENYWIEQLKEMKKEDFQTVKRRQEMIEKRIRSIKARRQVIDERGQICDSKFFLRNHLK